MQAVTRSSSIEWRRSPQWPRWRREAFGLLGTGEVTGVFFISGKAKLSPATTWCSTARRRTTAETSAASKSATSHQLNSTRTILSAVEQITKKLLPYAGAKPSLPHIDYPHSIENKVKFILILPNETENIHKNTKFSIKIIIEKHCSFFKMKSF